ncbi:MAG TPA: DUF4382 domain-containing protein [Candidatus Acidoferrum sp.]|nr:DUF4382 domain-containing protein [Candidatus Acidoferrum sp.]
MIVRKIFAALLLLSVAFLTSCSGLPKKSTCTSNCGGTATMSMTMRATPPPPPPNTNLLSFVVDVNTVTLTSSNGTTFNIPLNATSLSVDLTKLQSDSILLGTSAAVPADTYASITVSLSNPVVTFCTQTQGNTGCAPGSVATISGGAAATPAFSSKPFPLTVTANQKTALAINLNISNTLTVNSQVISAVNLAAANVLSASTLPSSSTSLNVSQLDFVEDVTGIVTAVNAATQSVTVKTAARGSLTAIANSSTVFSPNCTSFSRNISFASCVVQGDVASLDMVLNSDGTLALLEYDPLNTASGDWIEGVITASPSSSTQFSLVTNDAVFATSGSLIGGKLVFGAVLNATLSSLTTLNPFLIDSKGLVIPVNNFANSTDATVFVPGQTVSLRVTAFTAASGSTPASATVDTVYLRFTRVSGTVAASGTQSSFAIQNLPTFFGPTTQQLVQITLGSPPSVPSTNFEGVASATGLSNPQTVSIRALYFGQNTGILMPFTAAKVRVP